VTPTAPTRFIRLLVIAACLLFPLAAAAEGAVRAPGRHECRKELARHHRPASPAPLPQKTTDDGDSDPVDGCAGTPDHAVVLATSLHFHAPKARDSIIEHCDADAGPRRRRLPVSFVPRPPPASFPL
jgi:hypothetical protein